MIRFLAFPAFPISHLLDYAARKIVAFIIPKHERTSLSICLGPHKSLGCLFANALIHYCTQGILLTATIFGGEKNKKIGSMSKQFHFLTERCRFHWKLIFQG